jgi:hypothetical protein
MLVIWTLVGCDQYSSFCVFVNPCEMEVEFTDQSVRIGEESSSAPVVAFSVGPNSTERRGLEPSSEGWEELVQVPAVGYTERWQPASLDDEKVFTFDEATCPP